MVVEAEKRAKIDAFITEKGSPQAETGIRTHQTTDCPSIHTRYGPFRRMSPDFTRTDQHRLVADCPEIVLKSTLLAVSRRQRWVLLVKSGTGCCSGAPPPEDTRPPSAPPPAASSSEPSPCRATSISLLKKVRRRESRARTGDSGGRGAMI